MYEQKRTHARTHLDNYCTTYENSCISTDVVILCRQLFRHFLRLSVHDKPSCALKCYADTFWQNILITAKRICQFSVKKELPPSSLSLTHLEIAYSKLAYKSCKHLEVYALDQKYFLHPPERYIDTGSALFCGKVSKIEILHILQFYNQLCIKYQLMLSMRMWSDN